MTWAVDLANQDADFPFFRVWKDEVRPLRVNGKKLVEFNGAQKRIGSVGECFPWSRARTVVSPGLMIWDEMSICGGSVLVWERSDAFTAFNWLKRRPVQFATVPVKTKTAPDPLHHRHLRRPLQWPRD